MAVNLTLKSSSSLPIELAGILPEACVGKSIVEIEKLEILHGKVKLPLAELFQVDGSPDDEVLRIQGNCRSVHWIGANMTRGTIRVDGNVGRHLGSQMSGGEINVQGNASDWLGAEMGGGRIDVLGNAGHQVGAAYRGSSRGMRGGEILIRGDAGNEIGCRMRRGLIAVAGKSGDAPGYAMLAGTILLFGEAGIRPGANMKRGTIVCFSRLRPEILPTFRYAARLQPGYLNVLFRSLKSRGFPVEPSDFSSPFDLFSGDFLEQGRGEILLATS